MDKKLTLERTATNNKILLKRLVDARMVDCKNLENVLKTVVKIIFLGNFSGFEKLSRFNASCVAKWCVLFKNKHSTPYPTLGFDT